MHNEEGVGQRFVEAKHLNWNQGPYVRVSTGEKLKSKSEGPEAGETGQ